MPGFRRFRLASVMHPAALNERPLAALVAGMHKILRLQPWEWALLLLPERKQTSLWWLPELKLCGAVLIHFIHQWGCLIFPFCKVHLRLFCSSAVMSTYNRQKWNVTKYIYSSIIEHIWELNYCSERHSLLPSALRFATDPNVTWGITIKKENFFTHPHCNICPINDKLH